MQPVTRQAKRSIAAFGLGLGVVLWAPIAIQMYRATTALVQSARWVEHTHAMLRTIRDLSIALMDAENGCRGFVSTGAQVDAEQHLAASTAVNEHLGALQALIADNPDQQGRLQAIEPLIRDRLASLSESIALRKTEGFASPRQRELTEHDRGAAGNIRSRVREMEDETQASLVRRREEAAASFRNALLISGVASLLSVALLVVVFTALRRQVARRQHAEHLLREHANEIEDLHNNAPCAYYSLDANGTFVRANDTLLQWLGYSRDELVGKIKLPDLLTPTGQAVFQEKFPHFQKQGWIRDLDIEVIRKDGTAIAVIVNATAVRDETGKFLHSRSTMVDITERKQAEAALRRSEEQYRRLVEDIAEVIYAVDQDGRVTYISPVAETLLGYTAAHVIGRPFSEFVFPADIPTVGQRFREGMSGHPQPDDHRVLTKSGEVRWVRNHSRPILEGHRIVGLRGVLTDVTERKRMEEEIAALNQLLERRVTKRTQELSAALDQLRLQSAALESAADAIIITDRVGRIAWVNPAFTRITGYTAADAVGQTGSVLGLGHRDETFYQQMRQTILSGQAYRSEISNRRKDGSRFTAELVVTPVRDAHGTITHFVEIQRDITESKWAERLMRLQAAALQTAANSIVITDRHGTIQWANEAFTKLTGYPVAEAIGQNPRILKSGKHEPGFYKRMWNTITADRVWYGEVVNKRKDGSLYTEAMTIAAVHADGAGITHFIAIKHDVTERKRMEEDLRRTNRALRLISECNVALVRATDEAQLLEDICRLAVDNGGYRFAWVGLAEAEGAGVVPAAWAGHEAGYLSAVTVTRSDTEHGRGPVGTAIRTGEVCVVKNVMADEAFALWRADARARGYASVIALPLMHDGRPFAALAIYSAEADAFDAAEVQLLVDLAHDLSYGVTALRTRTAREHAERLRHAEAEVSGALARVGQELIGSLNTSQMLERLCEVTAAVLRCDYALTAIWEPDSAAYTPAAAHGLPAEFRETISSLKFPDDAAARLRERLVEAHVLQTSTRGEPWLVARLAAQYGITGMLFVGLQRGTEHLGLLNAGRRRGDTPFTAAQERIANGIGQLASLALEHARLIDELDRAHRLKADFMSTMSRELRSPLSVIMGYNQLLLGEAFGALVPEQIDALEHTHKSATKLLEFINAALDVGRLDAGQAPLRLEEIDLVELFRAVEAGTLSMYEKPGVQVDWQVPPGLPRLRTDAVKLKVIIRNLLSNALQFTDHGRVTVSACTCDAGVEIAVTDTGIGIAPEVLPTIFEPFHHGDGGATPSHGGAGLGLYIVRRLLDLLGGTITVETEVGHGSTFRVRLPLQPGGRL